MSKRQQRRKLQQRRLRKRVGIVGSGALALTLLSAGTAEAKQPTFKVTSLKDSGRGTLRTAITDADAARTKPSSPALITFASRLTGSIDLETNLPYITDSIDIRGPGADKVTINPDDFQDGIAFSVISDYSANTSLTISGLSMSNFYAEAPEHGGYSGFVGADHVTLKLINDTFRDDSVTTSGTIYAHGGSVTIDKCSFSHDQSQQKSAGAAYVLDGKLTIDNSTFSDDSTADFGGAVKSVHSPTTITDSTFTGNSAYGGGALYLTDSKTTITAATIIGNHALTTYGGGIAVDGGTLTLANTIVAGNTETNHANADKTLGNYSDVWVRKGATLVANFSLIQHNPGDFDPAPGTPSLNSTDILDKSADLGPLAFNGGPTETELPKPGSPAINAGQAFGLKTDQRGDKRTVDYPGVKKRKGSDGTDIGAVELQAPKHS